MSQTYISSNCLTTGIYQHFGRAYDNPFVASLFVNDDQYVKFCQHFDYYIAQTPKFSLPSEASPWYRQNSGGWYRHEIVHPPYPVMYLDDIEIHWIHEESEEVLLDKYNRRLKRFRTRNLEPVFIWCSADLLQDHTPEEYTKLITDFISIPTSIYLTRYASDTALNRARIVYFEPWADTTDERDESGLYKFTNINEVSTNFKYILYIVRPVPIKNPLIAIYLIGTPTMWSYTRDYITKLIGNADVYVCGYGEPIPYSGKTVVNTHYSSPHPVEMVGETTEAINQYNLQMCVNRCEEERKKLKLSYDYYLYLNVNGLLSTDDTERFPGEKSSHYLHAGAYTQFANELVLVSNQHTNLGPISSLSPEQRKFIYDALFEGKVTDNLDFSTLELDDNSIVFLIPSVIYIAWKNPQRSVFSPQERLNQTLEQLKSIRAHPNAKIILLEMSEPSLEDLRLLSHDADRVCLFTKDEQAQGYAHHHWNKNLGELYVLSYAISKLKLFPVFSHVVKFGGRYKMMSDFRCEKIAQSKPVFRTIPPQYNCYKQPIIEPVLYSIPQKYLSTYAQALSTIQTRLKTEASDVERMMYTYLPEKIEVDHIGICGYGAVSGVFRII